METLTLFNQQVLQCQDDAYTLAWYLLGDEGKAAAVTQAAVEGAYPCFASNHANCRLLILRQVILQCQEHKLAASSPVVPGLLPGLRFLAQTERMALALIDVLGLDYADAAYVVDRSRKEFMRLLAQARRRLGRCAGD